jgi:hypothetical protein
MTSIFKYYIKMDLESDFIIDILKEGPNLTKTICISQPAYDFLTQKLLPALLQIEPYAVKYCSRRNTYDEILNPAETTARSELDLAFKDYSDISIHLMSSKGAKMHLIVLSEEANMGCLSDIDFGVLVKDLTQEKIQTYSNILEKAGYKFSQEINHYFVFWKQINGIDIEVKLRDFSASLDILQLHQCLDNLSYQTQQLLTYAKAITFSDTNLYTKLKKIIYSAYYTQIHM